MNAKRSTLFLWKKYYKEQGPKGLNPKSKRPKRLRKPQWSKKLKSLVFKLRKKHPYWGKEKIHHLLKRDYKITKVSISTVGRILKYFIELNKIQPVSMVTGKRIPKKKRVFNKHAKRWKYGMKAKQAGELVQIDHMSVYSKAEYIESKLNLKAA